MHYGIEVVTLGDYADPRNVEVQGKVVLVIRQLQKLPA